MELGNDHVYVEPLVRLVVKNAVPMPTSLSCGPCTPVILILRSVYPSGKYADVLKRCCLLLPLSMMAECVEVV